MKRPRSLRRPVVYGDPEQTAVLLDSTARLIDHEPDETFIDPAVQDAAQNLSDRLARRLKTEE